jgi:hypothetical protein
MTGVHVASVVSLRFRDILPVGWGRCPVMEVACLSARVLLPPSGPPWLKLVLFNPVVGRRLDSPTRWSEFGLNDNQLLVKNGERQVLGLQFNGGNLAEHNPLFSNRLCPLYLSACSFGSRFSRPSVLVFVSLLLMLGFPFWLSLLSACNFDFRLFFWPSSLTFISGL